MRTLFELAEGYERECLDFITDICNIESPTDDKAGVDEVGAYIKKSAEALGWRVERQREAVSGDPICITMNHEVDAQAVVFSGHLDTVHPKGLFGYPPVREEGESLYGPGVVDCKGGIGAAFYAMKVLRDMGYTKRPIKLILQTDEETSSRGSDKATIRYMAEKSKGCIGFFDCEGSNIGKVTTKRKGISKYVFEITGKAAHAGKCYDGVSAIVEASHKIIALEEYKDCDGITMNCGTISGGTVPNTVPEECSFTLDIRFSSESEMKRADKIVEEIAKKSFVSGTSCRVTLLSRRVPMERCEENLVLLERINGIFADNGMSLLKESFSNGGSDASDMTFYKIPCLDSLGVEGEGIHGKGEHLFKASVVSAIKRLAVIAYNL